MNNVASHVVGRRSRRGGLVDCAWRSSIRPCGRAAADRRGSLPELTAPVNDFAHVIDSASAAKINALSRALKAASGDVVVVATVPTIEPYGDIREYAVKLFENHGRGIGDKGKDNGLLILLALKERRVWVEVGYALEQWVTDGFSGETSRVVMTPFFRDGRYGEGLRAGAARIVGRIAQGRNVTLQGVEIPQEPRRGGGTPIPGGVILLIFLAILALSRLGGGRGSGPRFWGGGGWSGWSSGVGSFGGGGAASGAAADLEADSADSAAAAAAAAAVDRVGKRNLQFTIESMNKGYDMKTTRRAALQIIALALVALPLTGCSYNTFVSQDEAIKAQWAQVQNQLQRRNDLIPNLVETVKGYATHEEGVYKDIADSRSRLLAAKSPEETIQAANQQTSALGRLLAIVENYPQLKANEQFNRLMDELSGTENRIAVERMRYNERVREYNTSTRQFPANLTAKMFGFKEHPFFEAPAEAQQVPKVNFNKPS